MTNTKANEIDPRYENGKIYKVVCNNTGRIYIGSTYHTIEFQLKSHEQNYKAYLKYIKCKENGKKGLKRISFKTSYKIIKDGNYKIELIKPYPCKNRTELEREEGRHQLEAKANENINCVNKNIAGRTNKEYREANRDIINKKKREKFTCVCGGKYTRTHKAQHFKSKKHQKFLKQKELVKKIMREILSDIINKAISNL